MQLLSVIIFLPIVLAIIMVFLPDSFAKYFKWVTLSTTLVQLLLAIKLYSQFDTQLSDYQFLEHLDWIKLPLGNMGSVTIEYLLGVDGISLPMVILSGIIMSIGAIASFTIKERPKAYYSLYLLLSGSIMGCFLSLDLILFYIFFEFMLLPMYFLIGLWGGPRREYASIKFFIYTLVGSLLILIVIIALYVSAINPLETAKQLGLLQGNQQDFAGAIAEVKALLKSDRIPTCSLVHTFDIRLLSDKTNYLPTSILSHFADFTIGGVSARLLGFLLLFLGFAVKLPAVPLHTWLPDAHVEAPTPVSVVLAGILLKIGGYGLIRIVYPIFPDGAAYFAYLVALVGVISIVYGAYNALAMNDLKKMIAYSSVSHMGFVLIGIAALNAEGLSGAIYQMFSHGILAAMLFLLVGVIYDRTHDRRIDSYRGLALAMPYYTFFTAIAFFASLGLPAFSGFIGEFFSLAGSFNSMYFPKYLSAIACFGLVLGAGYFLWTFQKMFLGKPWVRNQEIILQDLNVREKTMLIPLFVLTLILGIFPSLLFDVITPAVIEYLKIWY
ncbi:MAG: NADH-quinone oxidoreductase subunit M [Pseudarcicella sp.]|nr:NADH-quinone oxidoreductase subunit M [Pseudarcicella sp.]